MYKNVSIHKTYRYKNIRFLVVTWNVLLLYLNKKSVSESCIIEIRDNKIQPKYPESILVDYSQEYL